jgi:hypothetical protein
LLLVDETAYLGAMGNGTTDNSQETWDEDVTFAWSRAVPTSWRFFAVLRLDLVDGCSSFRQIPPPLYSQSGLACVQNMLPLSH